MWRQRCGKSPSISDGSHALKNTSQARRRFRMFSRYVVGTAFVFLAIAPALSEQGSSHAPAATPPPLFTNLGNYHHKITTKSGKAQKYFDQGLRLIYAFNHDEAGRAFHEAARLDPNCAMAYWGVALTLGPNYNLAVDPERDHAAYEAIQH